MTRQTVITTDDGCGNTCAGNNSACNSFADAVTLVLADPDTCNRLIEAATAARDFLIDLWADGAAEMRTATSESSPLALLPSL